MAGVVKSATAENGIVTNLVGGLVDHGDLASTVVDSGGSVVLGGSGLALSGDVGIPGASHYYGTGPTGTKGWFPFVTPRLAVATKNADYTLTDADEVILADASVAIGQLFLDLPTAVGRAGKMFRAKKIDSGGVPVKVRANGSETVDGAGSKPLNAQYDHIAVVSDGSNWYVV